jgi:hypothetical protein
VIRLFADFQNAAPNGRVRLNTVGTFEDLERLGIELENGMQVILEDRESLVGAGTVLWEPGEGWVADVDWDRVESVGETEPGAEDRI